MNLFLSYRHVESGPNRRDGVWWQACVELARIVHRERERWHRRKANE
jgi:hypothetical protein